MIAMPGSPGPLRYSGWEPQPLPEPWIVAPADMRSPLEAELRAEVADGHLLSGETVTAIARCQACDDVVFSVEGDHPVWFAIVHLTWRRSREPVPWPATQPLRLPLAESLRAHTH
jgi:hypothetical protein